ncbi:MAG: type II toxin-antitoxin system PemK/MazF family toxin [Melioribacteraceae bacterium]|nr:type II toxin-antitoxin system PemK/MazF family toxin [Melioribacteraceae bacterium]MCF8264676.1 type II toxin-antitoxin system PemK/MazF family toxin [Melioribacteraceae bacterium]MCF8431596.1 type II toxin-antitoxin system PemK/MazF family toxin [Melioribacteraceae bacterium]
MKVRPALCLTSENGKHEHVVVAFISSIIPKNIESSDLVINKNDSEFKKTGLRVSSIVRLHKIISIPKELIRSKLGIIGKDNGQKIISKLLELFELDP